MTQKGRRILPLVLALALALTGGLLLWRGADRDGVGVTRLTLDGTVLRLYRLGDAGSETVILTDHADGDGGHTHTLTLGGQSSAALVPWPWSWPAGEWQCSPPPGEAARRPGTG